MTGLPSTSMLSENGATFFSTTADGMAEERNRWLAKGVRILSIGSDRRLIHTAMASAFQSAKAGQ